MRRITEGLYIHRGYMILKHKEGWMVDYSLNIFKALIDCKNYINKSCDSTNTGEPRIIREWTIEKDYRK